MSQGLQLSASTVARLVTQIFGHRRPEIFDVIPSHFGGTGPRALIELVSGPQPQPWREVLLNPQPLPPGELQASLVADAHIHELLGLDRLGALFGGEVAQRTRERSLQVVGEIEELCPRWPRWPNGFPPPPPPPWGREDEMSVTQLFVFGTRFLAAAEMAEQSELRQGLTGVGEKALGLSMQG
jgi:hypothetical protein